MSDKKLLKGDISKKGANLLTQYFVVLDTQQTYEMAEYAKKFFYDIKGEELMILKNKKELLYYLAASKIYSEKESDAVLDRMKEVGFLDAFKLSITEVELI